MLNLFMQRASYKGVRFEVTASTITAGRRVVLHEYPFRDTPFAEDLGRRARTVTIDAFIFGDDARAQSERLIAAVESAGAGTLIHPLYGSMQCIATDGTSVSTELCDDYVAVSFSLTEVGSLTFPSADGAADYLARLSADALQSMASETLTTVMAEVESRTDISLGDVYDSAHETFEDCCDTVYDATYTKLWAMQEAVSELKGKATEIVTDAGQAARDVLDTLGIASRSDTVTDWREVTWQSCELAQMSGFYPDTETGEFVPLTVSTAGRSRMAMQTTSQVQKIATATTEAQDLVKAAIKNLFRMTMLAQAIGGSTLIGTAVDRRDEDSDILVVAPRRDVASVRTKVLETIDAEAALHDGHEMIVTLYDARVRVWTDLSTRADPVSSIVSKELVTMTPSLVFAYQLYGDASREAEIVDRNGISEPMFCVGSLELRNE